MTPSDQQPEHIGLVPLALDLKVAPERVRLDLRKGRIEAVKMGRDWRFTRRQVEAARQFYADQGRVEGP